MNTWKMLLAVLVILAAGRVQAEEMKTMTNVHSFTMETIDGNQKNLADYKGKVLLIVNTASKCGFTGQYKSLESLYEKYKDRGFMVLAFPANDFLGQEPGNNGEIKKFCELKYKTTFPVFAKTSVKGKNINPLYQYLTTALPSPGDISWNFNKFLVDIDGNVTARFGSRTDPLDQDLVAELEKILLKQ